MNFGIGLTGAHRTGKSTLAEMYSEKYGIPYVKTQVSKIITDLGYSPNIQYDIKTRIDIQNKVLENTIELWETQTTPFITDRTPVDMVGYMIANATQDELTKEYDTYFVNYVEKCKAATNKYFKQIITIPPAIKVVEEFGKANTTKTYINHIAYVIHGFIDMNKNDMYNVTFNHMPVSFLTYSERMSYINYVRGL